MKKRLLSLVLAVLTVITCAMFISCKLEVNGPTKYTVKFDSMGGSTIVSQKVEENTYAQRPHNPMKLGDTFLYWYLDSKNISFDFENSLIESDITLKARWESDVTTYTVTFDSGGGSPVASQQVKDYETVQMPQEPTKAGDTFLCWYLDAQNNVYDFENSLVESDITLKARWQSDPTLYTIFYKIGDAIYDMQEIGRNGYYATKPENPIIEDKTFVYWYLENKKGESKKEPFDFSETEITKNITLKALVLSSGMQEGQIKFYLGVLTGQNAGGISGMQNITAKAGDEILLPVLIPELGDEFYGWVNATTGEKYLMEDYEKREDYKFIYDGSPLVMYALGKAV